MGDARKIEEEIERTREGVALERKMIDKEKEGGMDEANERRTRQREQKKSPLNL